MRYNYIDIAKGIGILLVIMAHRCGFPRGTGIYFTACSVQMFFILAGYVYKNKYKFKEYVAARWKRVMIPYFKYNFILLFLFFILGWKREVKECILAVAGILYSTYCLYFPISSENNIYFFLLSNGPTWFFTAFFCSNILFFIILSRSKKEKALFLLITVLLTKLLGELPVFLPWNLDKTLVGAALMLLGYEMKEQRVFDKTWSWMKLLLFLGIGVCYCFLVRINPNINIATSHYGDAQSSNVFLCIIIGCMGTYICVEISKIMKDMWIGKLLELVGRHTLLLLGFHLFLFELYDRYIGKYILIGEGTYLRACMEVLTICTVIVMIDCFMVFMKKKYAGMVSRHAKQEY